MSRLHARVWRAVVGMLAAAVVIGLGTAASPATASTSSATAEVSAATASTSSATAGVSAATAGVSAATAEVSSATEGPSESFVVDVPEGPASGDTIEIDVDLYLPATSDPAPAVLLAHGFGGTKNSLNDDAERLRSDGFVVMTYSARGFGKSGGRISLDSVEFEVADASRLVDALEQRPEVEKRDGNPVVGVYGPSYGGALALMLGATDPRIDAVVSAVTWNDLSQALVPRADSTSTAPGVFKQGWATQLFGAAASPRAGPCGRFTAQFCALYTKLVGGGTLDSADEALLSASSPASVLSGMTAPTLLLQGRQDTLFGFDQADANARQIDAAGAPVTVEWFAGGHDGGLTTGTSAVLDGWMQTHLMNAAATADTLDPDAFSFTVPASARQFDETRIATSYPGLTGNGAIEQRVQLNGRPGIVVNPPGGLPATTTSIPGIGSVDSLLGGSGLALTGAASQPAQQAQFTTDPIDEPFVLVGSPTVTVDVGLPRFRGGPVLVDPSTSPRDVVLFAQLRVKSGDTDVAVGGGVTPIRVTLPSDGSRVAVPVTLPATTWRFEEGDEISIALRTTDAGYHGETQAATFLVDADTTLSLPTVASTDPAATGGSPSTASIVGIAIVLALALLLAAIALRSGRRRASSAQPHEPAVVTADAAPPLVIRGLTKDYRAGFRAVDDLSFTVQRGQVLGLLGPNGAGKTTALRMVTGLLRPDAGEIEIFGERVTPGARVLDRIGCFIEGPGFLPHLSGRRNLQLYWAASGRPLGEARLDEALRIADLGTAVDRRVGGYSQGMRQRLAIAQAMLGMPELLILDEPTNGLDPPQIFALRGVLRSYAESGRTVIVSSHLLGEVEQTCTDVVVMARGRLLAAGTVAEVAGDSDELTIEVTDVEGAIAAVARLDGASAHITRSAQLTGSGVTASGATTPGAIRVLPGDNSAEGIVAAVVAAGIGVRSVTRGRHLEETFLSMVGSEGIS